MAGEQLRVTSFLLHSLPQASGERRQERTVPSTHPLAQETRFWEGSWEEVRKASLSPPGQGNQCRVLGTCGSGEPAGVKPCLRMTS